MVKRGAVPAFLAFLAFLAVAGAAPGGDGIEAVNVVWRDFVAAMRRGDYPAAHLMFSEQSRAAFPFSDFIREYGPLSAARETLLADPASLATRINGDWGEIRFAIRLPVSRRGMNVAASLVRNDGAWSLVAARNEERERHEAGARDLLRQLQSLASRRDARELEAAAVAARRTPGDPLMLAYDFVRVQNRFRAIPKISGLRAFHLDNWGMVKQGMGEAGSGLGALAAMPSRPGTTAVPAGTPPPAPGAAMPGKPFRAGAPGNAGPLPELTEPPADRTFPAVGELADPGDPSGEGSLLLPPPELSDPFDDTGDVPPPAGTPSTGEPAVIALPDRIS